MMSKWEKAVRERFLDAKFSNLGSDINRVEIENNIFCNSTKTGAWAMACNYHKITVWKFNKQGKPIGVAVYRGR